MRIATFSSFLSKFFTALAIIAMLLAATPAQPANAAACTFTSAATGAWGNAGTWTAVGVACSTTPGATFTGDTVVIADGNVVTLNVSPAQPIGSLQVGQGTSGTLTIGNNTVNRTLNVSGNVTVNNGATLNTAVDSGNNLLISGNLTNNGTLDLRIAGATTNTTFNGTASQIISGVGGTTNFNRIIINNSGAANDDIVEMTSANFTVPAGFLTLTNGTFKVSGTFALTDTFFNAAGYTIAGGNGLWINNPNVTVTGQASDVTLNGTLRVTAGTYTVGTTSGHALDVGADGAALIIEGGTVNIAQRFSSSTFATNFTMSGGTLNLGITGVNMLRSLFDLSTTTSTFTMSGGTIVFPVHNGGVAGLDFRNNSTTNNISGGTVQFGDATTVAGTAYRIATGAVLPSITINSTNSPTVSANGSTTVMGDITINTGTTLNANNQNITVSGNSSAVGNWTNNGTFTAGTGTVTFNGTDGAQSITGATTFNNLTLNNVDGLNINNNETVNGILTFTNGKISTGANSVIFPVNATVSGAGTGRYVYGNVQRAFTAGNLTFSLPIGDSTNYAPVDLTFNGITTGGNVTASTTASDCAAGSDINPNKSVNHCWTLTNSGVVFTNYDPTFNFVGVGTDADAGANTGNFIVQRFSGGTWSPTTTGTRTATSTDATGVTAMSDFAVGEIYAAPLVTTSGGTTAFNEGAPVVIDSGVTVTDADSPTLASGTVSITSNFLVGEDQLLFTDANGIAGSYNSGTGVLTLTGSATVAEWQAALRSVQYGNTSDNPSTTTRTVSFTVNDGSLNSNTDTKDVSVASVDDAPVAVNDAATVTEDAAATTINVLGNDTDIDGGLKSIASVTQPTNGTVVITNAGADLTYQPNANYCNDGTPTDDFTYTLNGGSSTSVAVTVNCVDDAPIITSAPPASGTVGVAYFHTYTATGTTPISYSITTGALPAGLTLTSGGSLSGTPTAGGIFTGTVTATNGVAPDDTQNFSITINAPTITLSPTSLPDGALTFAYNQTIAASGGTIPHTFNVTAGALPTGLSLSSAGVLSGTPTAVGTFNFTVTATDSSGGTGPYTGSRAYSITINGNTTVTIDQAAGQADPTNLSPVNFTVVFSSAVTGFDATDVDLSASTAGGTLVANISGSGPTYTVGVTGMTTNGDVIASIPAGAALDGSNLPNAASTSTDKTVTYETTIPTVTSSTPANSGTATAGLTQLTVTFSEDVRNDGSTGAANNTANYLLVEDGSNNIFDTLLCSAGLVVDDTPITIGSASYTNNGGSGPFVATLTVNPLGAGTYRLFVCGTTSIEDLAGNELNNGQSDAQVNFTVPSQGGGGGTGRGNTVQSAATTLLPATGFPMNQVSALPVQPADKVYASTDLWLEIPKLGVKMSIVGVPNKGEWDVTWLGRNAGWLNGSAYPTWNGNSVITGHVWDALNQPGPFAKLKELKYGDQIKIHAFGSVYVYEIRTSESISPTGSSKVFKHEEKSWLTLITCEDYKELSNTYLSRRMIKAVLLSVSPEK